MKEVSVGKKFSAVVPNGLKLAVRANLSGERHPTVEILSSNTWEDPKISCIGQESVIHFAPGTPPRQSLELIIRENGAVNVDREFTPAEQQARSFRDDIEHSYNSLFPDLYGNRALTFDQSYYTRSYGQIYLAKALAEKEPLTKSHNIFSGMGFGAIQAAWFATGGSADDLLKWWSNDLHSALQGVFSFSKDRKGPGKVIKAVKKLFTDPATKRELLISELKGEIFIPLMDINGTAFSVTRNTAPSMPVWQAAICSVLDPIEFETKPYIEGMGLLVGDIQKSPDWLIYKINPAIKTTSIGCPARLYNHGTKRRSRENLAIIMKEGLHRLEQEKSNGLNKARLECRPVDHVKKFDFSRQAITDCVNSAMGIG